MAQVKNYGMTKWENRVQLIFLKFLNVEALWSFLERVIAVDAAMDANVLSFGCLLWNPEHHSDSATL